MKICLNCGDKLLDGAKKCPTCNTKDRGFPIVDSNDTETINEIISSVPNPKNSITPRWKKDMEQKNPNWREGTLSEQAAQLDKQGIAYCPKCLSTSISANKKGFGIGKAVAGAWAAGPIGLVAGNIGAKKVRITCLKCGHEFWAGK
ncbi:hypothetical protein [Desulfitobacterium hafniense]|uniref:hypothetical protein n=1 Tax=Desulfitobacterium hafniense TaxID=49338 RepID=UPI000366E107|nr:hypothetical protein [Desulfitobacterium hafniense]